MAVCEHLSNWAQNAIARSAQACCADTLTPASDPPWFEDEFELEHASVVDEIPSIIVHDIHLCIAASPRN
jgi:hypothetical protein